MNIGACYHIIKKIMGKDYVKEELEGSAHGRSIGSIARNEMNYRNTLRFIIAKPVAF